MIVDEHSDNELVRQFKSGDSRAFDAIVERGYEAGREALAAFEAHMEDGAAEKEGPAPAAKVPKGDRSPRQHDARPGRTVGDE